MKRNEILKKIRKATRRNRVESLEYFWQEIRETGWLDRVKICWTILWYKRERRTLQVREIKKTEDAIPPPSGVV